jgi:hypothetical protein
MIDRTEAEVERERVVRTAAPAADPKPSSPNFNQFRVWIRPSSILTNPQSRPSAVVDAYDDFVWPSTNRRPSDRMPGGSEGADMSQKSPISLVTVAFAFALVLALGSGGARAEPTYVTGCIGAWRILSNVAVGTSPSAPCTSALTQVTWEVVDPNATPPAQSPKPSGPTLGFYVTLDGDGAEQTLATNGPLEFFARCTVDATSTTVEVYATSSQDGWFSSMGGPHAAGEELLHYSLQSDGIDPEYGDNALRFESSIVSPDGHFLVVGNESMTPGTRMFGHDCLAIGTAIAITGTS